MNWSFKFAFDEIEELFDNSPWLLVDDKLETKPNAPDEQGKDFINMQNQFLLQRGWDWFQTVVRGRKFKNLNLTTFTVWDAERHPENGDSPEVVQQVRDNFPGITLVSLIGGAHVIEGTGYVPPDILSALDKRASEQKWHGGFEKIASSTAGDDGDEDSRPYYKEEFQFEISDVDRYTTDKYFANLVLQETVNEYSVGFQMYNYQVGITGSVQYWHYDKDEFERAKKTFKAAKKALREVMTDLEYNRPPMAIITPTIRAALHPIDIPKKERSGNYFFNWFQELPKESDWRTTLYGNRYPGGVIQPIDVSWNEDDQSKDIVIEGLSSRSRVLHYKPSTPPNAKLAMDSEGLKKMLMAVWDIGSAGLAGGLLAWLLNSGISPLQLEQQLQQGATPQEVIRQVSPQNMPSEALDNVDLHPSQSSETPENLEFSAESPTETLDIGSLVDRIIQTESSGDPNATSPVGARGLMQIMPRTWKEWSGKVFGEELPFDKAFDPDLNVRVGTAYLQWIQNTLRSWMEQEPGIDHILSAYNGGIGRLRHVGFDVSRMPSESRDYVQKITGQKQGSLWNHTYMTCKMGKI